MVLKNARTSGLFQSSSKSLQLHALEFVVKRLRADPEKRGRAMPRAAHRLQRCTNQHVFDIGECCAHRHLHAAAIESTSACTALLIGTQGFDDIAGSVIRAAYPLA